MYENCYFCCVKIWSDCSFLYGLPCGWLHSAEYGLCFIPVVFAPTPHPPELLSPAAICLKNAYITSCENSFLQGLHEKAALHQMLLSFSAGSSRWQNICILHNLRDQSCVKVYAWIRMCLLMRTALTYSIISFFFYCTGHLKMSTNNNQFPQPSPPPKKILIITYYHLWFYYPYYVAARF